MLARLDRRLGLRFSQTLNLGSSSRPCLTVLERFHQESHGRLFFCTSQQCKAKTVKRDSISVIQNDLQNPIGESSVSRGTRFELLSKDVLQSVFGMELERTGGAGDRGIDLRGWWKLPTDIQVQETVPSERIRVIAQCKCQDVGGKKIGPVLIREVEGVLHRASSSVGGVDTPNQSPVTGIILSSSGFSKQALLQVMSSGFPIMVIHLQQQMADDSLDKARHSPLANQCLSIVWNDKFGGKNGLLRDLIQIRWERSFSLSDVDDSTTDGRPVLYLKGQRFTPT